MLCLSPLRMPNGLIVPCGKCFNCRRTKRNVWAFRMYKELKYCKSSGFITLTYEVDKRPKARTSPKFRAKYGLSIKKPLYVLSRDDVADFLHSIQKQHKQFTGNLARFYLIGEYGDLFKAPHYHAIMYFQTDKETSENIVNCAWNKGIVDFAPVNYADIVYCAKHQFKVSDGTPAQNAYAPIFQTMSRKSGGIGSTFFKANKDYIINNNLTGFSLNGVRVPVPPYYRKLMRNNENLTDEQLSNLIITNSHREKQTVDYFASQFPYLRSYTDEKTRWNVVKFFKTLNFEAFHKYNVKRQYKIECKRILLSRIKKIENDEKFRLNCA